jgi:hypothetical protein
MDAIFPQRISNIGDTVYVCVLFVLYPGFDFVNDGEDKVTKMAKGRRYVVIKMVAYLDLTRVLS